MLFAVSEDPKIRKLLAEALAPTAFLEAGQHLLTMATAPKDRDFVGTSPRWGNSNSQGLGQQEHASWNNSASNCRGNQKAFLLRLDPEETVITCSEEHKTLYEEQQQWKTYLQQKQSLSQWLLFQKPKLATMEGNNKNCARRHSLESSTPLYWAGFLCGHVGD